MTLTIELEPEIEERLAEKAEQKGLRIETFIKVLLEESANGKTEISSGENGKYLSETATKEERLAAFRRFLDSRKDTDYPVLPDEAYSRESIYEDRF